MIKKISDNIYIFISAVFAILGMMAAGCTSDREVPDEVLADMEEYVSEITVSVASHGLKLSTRSEGEDPGQGEKEENEGEAGDEIDYTEFDIDKLTPYTLDFDENSIIQVSQIGRNQLPFESPEVTYDFSYIPGSEDATWDGENTYNFRPYEADTPLKWNTIGETGSWRGGFGLFSLYFPIENQLRQKMGDEGTYIYSVMEDQSTLENLKKSDILGAYHTTPALFSRLRFRLFHLMTYVRIRLFVPVYDDEKNTGYRNDALLYATLNNVTPDFAINWTANRSGDTQAPAVDPLEGEGNIKMYLHPLPEGVTEYPITKIKYKDYLRDGYFDQKIDGDYDTVRVYDFSVIIPLQTGMMDETGQQGPFAKSDFLHFYFRTNSGATTRYYFNQTLTANSTDSEIALNQGVYQYLQLYVPRVGNQVVYVGAKVNPWNQRGTEMLLTPEEE